MTIAFWLKSSGTVLKSRIFDFSNNKNTQNIGFMFSPLNCGDVYLCLTTCTHYYDAFNGSLIDGTWNHVAFTISASGLLNTFRNGVLVYSNAAAVVPPTVIRSINSIGTNTHDKTTASAYSGELDEFYLFDSALTNQQVYNLYLQGKSIERTFNFPLLLLSNRVLGQAI